MVILQMRIMFQWLLRSLDVKSTSGSIAILVEFSNYSFFSLQTLKSGGVQEQWLTDLHYCFNVYITGHPQGPSVLNTVYERGTMALPV